MVGSKPPELCVGHRPLQQMTEDRREDERYLMSKLDRVPAQAHDDHRGVEARIRSPIQFCAEDAADV